MLQKFLVLLLFFVACVVYADVVPRDSADDIMDTTRVTKIPFGFFKEKMEQGTYKVVDKEDLSEYQQKKIFAGYGIFDVEEKNCKYVENEDNKKNFTIDFEKINVFNNNTFAISRSKMGYAQCVALAQKYVGEVYAPRSIVEDSSVTRGNFLEDDAWIGMQRRSCEDPYINSSGIKQGYENFLYTDEPCDETKLNVSKVPGQTSWVRKNMNEYRKCIIRIKTNDYKKPIKICAPWWRIESTFLNKNKESLLWDGHKIDFDNFLMPDIPQRVNICTERKVIEDTSTSATKKVTCKRYYSRFAGGGKSGECLEDPIQPACEINECSGYIENNCQKVELLDSYKDYTWGYVTIRGVNTRVKIYDKIRTYVYECPAVNPNENNCLKREEVLVFPKECPGSQCDLLRTCIQSNAHTATHCKETYPCEKVYGDPAIAPAYNDDGTIRALKAKCSDGTIIENDQIREQTYSKTDCVRYEEIKEVNTTIKKCINAKIKTVHELNASITEPDIYADNPNCVRTNNIEDSRPYVDAVFEYINRGFFTTVIEKAYISGEINDTTDEPDPINQLPYQISNIRSSTYTSAVRTEVDTSGTASVEECNTYFNSDNWYQHRVSSLYSNPSVLPLGVLSASSDTAPYPVAAVVKAFDCNITASNLGLQDITDEVSYEDYPFSMLGIMSNDALRDANTSVGADRTCVLGDTLLSGDTIIKLIGIDASNDYIHMSTDDLRVDELQCQKFAACLGLHVSSSYSDPSMIQTCEMDNLVPEPPVDFNPRDGNFAGFVETRGTIPTSLDGTKDMIVLQEYAPGRFGYMSNYRFQLPKNNIIKLNNKEIFPLVPNAPINENLTYKYDVYSLKQTCKNESPDTSFASYFETLSFGAIDPTGSGSAENNYGAAALGGAAAGLTALLVTSPLSATGIGIVVAVLIVLFAGNESYGMLRSHWSIHKTLAEGREYPRNPYGYEFREYDPSTRDFTYERTKYQMAMSKKGNFESNLEDYNQLKQTSLFFAGYTREQINSLLLTSCEKDQCVGYPDKVKWYKFSGTNSDSAINRGVPIIHKPVNTIYMGATNTVVMFVPYLGDYEVVALDKYKNKLSSIVVPQSDFIDSDPYKHPFAKVMFTMSPDFALSQGVPDGNVNNACRYDDFAEWGGGVSGVYYEEGTPSGHHCAKSNDQYVQQSSAYYIKFRPVDSDKFFEIKLKKPMPFANRFYLVTLQKLETRRYECYEDTEPCTP